MDMNKIIQEKLNEIEEKGNIKILLAVESGSRAWGFASPDSDYDVRFIYVRPMEDYLRLDELKDVIEWQLDEVLDINGWDLKKTLIQFRKGNATLFEWSNSPIIYKKAPEWDSIYETTKSYFSAKAAIYHYYGTAKNTFTSYLQCEQVKYKKYLYALRPLLACKYIEQYNCPPPVLFDELLKMPLSTELQKGIDKLLAIKKVSDEQTLNPQIPVIYDFIANELEIQKEIADNMEDDHKKEWEPLNNLFSTCCPKAIQQNDYSYKTSLSIIAFIDILGARELINDDSEDALKTLHDCYENTLNMYKRKAAGKWPIPNFKIFSDNIVLSINYEENNDIMHSIAAITLFCSLFQMYCLINNLLVRGSITIGEFFQDDLMVWGKGLVRAYELESTIALFPRIIIDPAISEVFELTLKPSKTQLICNDYDGIFFIDPLSKILLKHWHDEIQFFIEENNIRIEKANENLKVIQKLKWLEKYLYEKWDTIQ